MPNCSLPCIKNIPTLNPKVYVFCAHKPGEMDDREIAFAKQEVHKESFYD